MNSSLIAFVIVAIVIGIPIIALVAILLRNSGAKKPVAPAPTDASVHDATHSLHTTLMASLLAQQASTAATSADTVAADTSATASIPTPPASFATPEISSSSGHIAPDQSCTNFGGHHH